MRKGMTLEFKVTQQEITRLDSQKVYEMTKGYLYAHFVFSDDWEGYLKTVKFSNLLDNSYIGVTLASDNTCMVPYSLVLYPGVTFCIEGTRRGDIITTNDFVFDVDESNSTVPEVPTDYLEITSNDFTIKDDKIVFSNYIANEIMGMNKRIKADYSLVENNIPQGQFIAVLAPRAIIDCSSLQDGLFAYEYSTTNYLLFSSGTTYVNFLFDKNTGQLYLPSTQPAINEDHIVGFNSDWGNDIKLTSDSDLSKSTINTLQINEFNTISLNSNSPKLQFNHNDKNELESVEFKQDGYSADFTYKVPKGAKNYVVNELPTTTDIDTTGNYYVMTESEDVRSYQSTDISNLTPTEYPSTKPNTLRQDATVNGDDFTQLQVSEAGRNTFRGDFAIKFNIPCNVLINLKPSQPSGSYMYLDVNGVNDLRITAGHDYAYARIFNVGETLYVRGECTSAHTLLYKLAIQPHIIDGKIPLSSNVDEYINYENMWFKNGGGSAVVANPTLSGDEATLNGLEVDGVKYAVGGGKLYLHKIRIRKSTLHHPSGFTIGTNLYLLYSIVTSSNEPITFDTFMNITHFDDYGHHFGTNITGDITITNTMRALNSFSSYSTNDRAEIGYIGDNAVLMYDNCIFDSVDIISDTITEV